MRINSKTFSVLILLFSSFYSRHGAADESKETASALFDTGTTAFGEERYSDAADAFREAYIRKPSWKLLFNIGQAEAACKHYGLALEAFERYMAEGGDSIRQDRQDLVYAEINRLREIVGYVEVTAPDGAEIRIDDVLRGTAPIHGELAVAATVIHNIVVKMGDRIIGEDKFKVAGGRTARIDMTPEANPEAKPEATTDIPAPTPEPVAPVPTPKAREHSRSPLKITGWLMVGVGAGALIGGAVTGGLTLSAQKDIDARCPDGCYSNNYDLLDRRDQLALATDILIFSGAAVAVIGTILIVVGVRKQKKETADISLAPLDRGIALTGRF